MASSIEEVEKVIMLEVKKALNRVSVESIDIMYDAIDWFYSGGEPHCFPRTGALGRSPRTTPITESGKEVSFDAYLDQNYVYDTGDKPSMDKVLALTNEGKQWTTSRGKTALPAVGNQGYWEKAEEEIIKKADEILGSVLQ